jgi:hypothetical protein
LTSLVLELQRAAMDKNVSIPDLLKMSQLVAGKLQLNDIAEWVDHELNGYPADDSMIPQYREIRGIVKGFHPYKGWLPVVADEDVLALVSKMKTRQPVSDLEAAIRHSDGAFYFPVREAFRELIRYPTDVRVFITKGSLVAILGTVRTTILDWSLKLLVENTLSKAL